MELCGELCDAFCLAGAKQNASSRGLGGSLGVTLLGTRFGSRFGSFWPIVLTTCGALLGSFVMHSAWPLLMFEQQDSNFWDRFLDFVLFPVAVVN